MRNIIKYVTNNNCHLLSTNFLTVLGALYILFNPHKNTMRWIQMKDPNSERKTISPKLKLLSGRVSDSKSYTPNQQAEFYGTVEVRAGGKAALTGCYLVLEIEREWRTFQVEGTAQANP